MNDHQLEDLAAKLWEQARDHASIMDSQTHIQRLTAGLAKVRDSYAQSVSDKDQHIDRLSHDLSAAKAAGKRMLEAMRKSSKTCPVCKVAKNSVHTEKCPLRKFGPQTWEPITGEPVPEGE